MAIFLSLRVIKKLGQRPCHVEYTSVDYDTDVKRHSVGTVLGWETSGAASKGSDIAAAAAYRGERTVSCY